MSHCTLEIADRLLLRSEGGPPEAEYALIDASEIELRALELGAIREVGYRTTVADAIARLEAAGITRAVVEEVEGVARTSFAPFARGEAARRILPTLRASELFDGAVYRSSERAYEGLVLDMPALSAAIGTVSAGATLQAIALASALQDAPDDKEVVLTTLPYMRERRPGERSFRRVAFRDLSRVVDALKMLDRTPPANAPAMARSARELLDRLRERGLSADRMLCIEQALTMATPPPTGPLADPSAWAIELQLSTGELMGALDRIDALERQRGRLPVTIYLRSRASLLMGAETPRAIAERVASLCASHPYAEFSLLAAQAWLSAGELDLALPFARAVVLNSEASATTRDRAEDILGAPETSRTGPPESVRALLGELSALLPGPPPMPPSPPEERLGLATALDVGWDEPSQPKRPASFGPKAILLGSPASLPPPALAPATKPPTRAALTSRPPPPRPRQSSAAPAVIDVPGELVPLSERGRAATQIGLQAPLAPRTFTLPSVAEPPPPLRDATFESVHPMAPAIADSASPSPDATLRLPSVPPNVPDPDRPSPVASAGRGTPSTFVPPSIPPGIGTSGHGASLPAFVSDLPPPHVPSPPRLPRFQPGPPELAETLSLPPGLHGQIAAPGGELPRGILEARVFFTHQSRELGREYRMRHGVVLKTDVQAIEQMQTILRERLPDGVIRTREEAMLVRRHGALLTEILARTLGAVWVDVAPTEIGYWAMLVPPATRAWPFGRLLRLLLRGYRERDLVSYYLELKARANRDA